MTGPTVYVKRARIYGEECTLYAISAEKVPDGGDSRHLREFLVFTSLAGPPDWLDRREHRTKLLPDEQSLLSFFPLDLLLGRARHVSRALDEAAWKLREARTNVLCFHEGCRQRARYIGLPPVGLEGGCWLACTPEHLSIRTTKGLPLNDEDYSDLHQNLQLEAADVGTDSQ